MRFVKMQGIGNDYVYVDCFREPLTQDPVQLAIDVSKYHYGVGNGAGLDQNQSVRADAVVVF